VKKPWESEKVWLAIIGLGTIVGLAALGQVADLNAWHVVTLVGSLILGRAWEGAAAAKSG
jgi:hypothetical protein